MEEIELEIVLDSLPDVPRAVEGLAQHLGLTPEHLGMTSTIDRLVDTEDLLLLSQDHSLRVRQKLVNMFAGNEIRMTYKFPLRQHDRLLIREEVKLKLAQPDFDEALSVLSSLAQGISGHHLHTTLEIDELAREANLGPKGSQLNLSVDCCTYRLPGQETGVDEIVFELESHGVPDEVLLAAGDWVIKELGGREAKQCKYARGLRRLGKL